MAISSNATGPWNTGSTWVGGAVPGIGDAVTILAAHTVTLDGACVAQSVTVAGVLTCSTTVNSSLTTQTFITETASATTPYVFDVSSNPTVTCTIAVNASSSTTAANQQLKLAGDTGCTFKGWHRTRKTSLVTPLTAGVSTSCTVLDATGWQQGDEIVFGTTDDYANPPHHDTVVLTNVTGNDIAWTGAVTYGHVAEGGVGNFTSNLVFTAGAVGAQSVFLYDLAYFGSDATQTKLIKDVLFVDGGSDYYAHQGQLSFNIVGGYANKITRLSAESCVFKNPKIHCFNVPGGGSSASPYAVTDCVGIVPSNGLANTYKYAFYMIQSLAVATVKGLLALGGTSTSTAASTGGIYYSSLGGAFQDCLSCGTTGLNASGNRGGIGIYWAGIGSVASNARTYSNKANLVTNALVTTCDGVLIGYANSSTAVGGSTYQHIHDTVCQFTLENGRFNTVGLTDLLNLPQQYEMRLTNIDDDVTKHSTYRPHMHTHRDNTTFYRSTSSITIKPQKINTACDRTLAIPCSAGQSVRVIGYLRRDTSTTAATVSISGLGITPVTYTASGALNSWEQYDLTATNNVAGYDGDLTLTYSAADSASTTATVWFDGVPDSPFITKCRHYGFVISESSPTRTVDPYTVATEAAAIVYSGVLVSPPGKRVDLLLGGTADTSQKMYDYIMALMCANLDYEVPFTRSGSLYSLTTGWSVTEPTFTDCTWSGTVAFASTGSKVGNYADCTLTFVQAGDYVLTGCNITGATTLVNTSGGAVTVHLSPGVAYTNAGPNITVDIPTVTVDVTFSPLVAGSQVVVYAQGTTTEMLRVNSTGTSETWSSASGAFDYTVQKAGYLPIRGSSDAPTASFTIPVTQSPDRAYAASAGLTYGTNCTVNTTTKRFGLTTASTTQNYYSYMIEQWISNPALRNVAFPIAANGPASFSCDSGWEFDGATSINYLSRDGVRYTSAGTVTASYAALLSVGVPTGMQVRYQQQDGVGTASALVTGNIDQLIQIYGDATHGNFDYTNWLVLKVQGDGYDQAEAVVLDIYPVLDDQFFVVGLAPAANGVAEAAITTGVTITDHGASPVTWNSKAYSITITSDLSGTEIVQYVRHANNFNLHDLVQVNGSKFKTVRGYVYGDVGAELKGVRVLTTGGAAHPDFDLMTADDGTTYSPPVVQMVTVTDLAVGGRVQIYDVTNSLELANEIAVGTSVSWVDSVGAVADRVIRLRIAYVSGVTAKEFIEVTAGTCGTNAFTAALTYAATQVDDAVYNTNAVNGGLVTGVTFTDLATDLINIDVAVPIDLPTIYAAWVYYAFTQAGIQTDIDYIKAIDGANYVLSNLIIKNVTNPSIPIKLTGGYMWDAITEDPMTCIDTSGGTIFLAPPHVVSKVVTVTGGNVITGDPSSVAAEVLAQAQVTPIHSDAPNAASVASAVWSHTQ